MRIDMIGLIRTELAESNSCVLRKTFIFFCKSSVNTFSKSFFKNNFLESYMSLSRDKVATVRMEFAHSLLYIKPFFDGETLICNDLMTILT